MKQSPVLQSTTNYYSGQAAVHVLRLALSAAQRLWPRLAVRAAYRLFGTPMPFLKPRRHPMAWDKAWQMEQWPFEEASITLYTPAAKTEGPAVLLLHGWGGNASHMLHLAELLAARGLRPVLADFPAHGNSRGRVSNLPQFARAIEYITARLEIQGESWQAVVAHSLGANAAAHASARGLAAARLVLLAPPASPYEFTRLFARMLGLSERTRAAMQRRIEAREGVLMRQFEPAAVGARIHQPTLVVHDRGDRINSFADGEAFRDHIPDAALLATQGLGHRKILQDESTLAAVADFVCAGPADRVKR